MWTILFSSVQFSFIPPKLQNQITPKCLGEESLTKATVLYIEQHQMATNCKAFLYWRINVILLGTYRCLRQAYHMHYACCTYTALNCAYTSLFTRQGGSPTWCWSMFACKWGQKKQIRFVSQTFAEKAKCYAFFFFLFYFLRKWAMRNAEIFFVFFCFFFIVFLAHIGFF